MWRMNESSASRLRELKELEEHLTRLVEDGEAETTLADIIRHEIDELQEQIDFRAKGTGDERS